MTTQSRPLLAALWMMGAVASFSAMAVAGREIMTAMNTFELMMYRSFIGFGIITLFLSLSPRGFAQIRTVRFGQHILRNVFHFTGQNLWFYGVSVISFAELVALEFTNPIWVALLAPIFLGERMTPPRLLAAALGFIGVLIIARPGIAPFGIGHWAGLGAALGFALNTLFTKTISRTDSVLCVLFWMTLLQAIFGTVLALPGGIPVPNPQTWIWLAIVGLCGVTAHLCLTSALSVAPATIVAPMEFVRLPVITMLGFVLYREALDPMVFAGALVVITANLINVRAEQRPRPAPN